MNQRIEIANRKSISRTEVKKSHSILPTVAIIENNVDAQSENPVRTIRGNRSHFSTTKHGKKYDSHIRQIKRIYEAKARLNGLRGSNIKQLDHFITPTMVEYRPDIVIIHIGFKDTTHNAVSQIHLKDIANLITNIGKKCLSSTSAN